MEKQQLEGCVHCRICEMVCSLHHTGAFGYEGSGIHIEENDNGYAAIRLTEGDCACDFCVTEEEPLCLRYCPKMKGRDALKAFLFG